MLLKNPIAEALRFEIDGRTFVVKPGATVEVPDGYCIPRQGSNGDPIKPIIKMLAPQLVPADETKVEAFEANQPLDGVAPEPPPGPTAADFMANGSAAGVADRLAKGEGAVAPRLTPGPKGAKA